LITHVLEHLVGVHDVEGVVGEVERVHVADGEVDRLQPAPADLGPGQIQRLLGGLKGGDPPGCDPRREVCGDGAGTAADVQQSVAGFQPWQQICRRIFCGAPAVRAQDRLVMPVGVDSSHAPKLRPCLAYRESFPDI
jgi:hypothetical protein